MGNTSGFMALSVVAIVAIIALFFLTIPQVDMSGEGGAVAKKFFPAKHSTFKPQMLEEGRYSWCEETEITESKQTSNQGCTQYDTITTITQDCYENHVLVSTTVYVWKARMCSPKGCGQSFLIGTEEAPLRTGSSTSVTTTEWGASGGTATTATVNTNMGIINSDYDLDYELGEPPAVPFRSCF